MNVKRESTNETFSACFVQFVPVSPPPIAARYVRTKIMATTLATIDTPMLSGLIWLIVT